MHTSKALLLLRKFQSFMRHHKNNSIVIDNAMYEYDTVFDNSISTAISALEEKQFRDKDPMFRNIYKLIDFCHINTKMNSDFIPIDDECINDMITIVKYCDNNKILQPELSCWAGGSGIQAAWDIVFNKRTNGVLHVILDSCINNGKKELSIMTTIGDDGPSSTMKCHNTDQACEMISIINFIMESKKEKNK